MLNIHYQAIFRFINQHMSINYASHVQSVDYHALNDENNRRQSNTVEKEISNDNHQSLIC